MHKSSNYNMKVTVNKNLQIQLSQQPTPSQPLEKKFTQAKMQV